MLLGDAGSQRELLVPPHRWQSSTAVESEELCRPTFEGSYCV